MFMRSHRSWLPVVLAAALLAAECGDGAPSADGLRDSFAAQLAAIPAVKDLKRNGDEITFSGPGAEGGVGTWRIQITSATVEPNTDPSLTYKGTITSSWYSNGQIVRPSGRESNLPVELMSNGLSQDCWAFWNPATSRWEWE
jgi:hypothetical protein